MSFAIRDARDDDAWDLIGLIAGCWSEYPGCILDIHGEVPELLAIATHYDKLRGRFWVAESHDRVVASVGIAPNQESSGGLGASTIGPQYTGMILTKLYVARSARNQGLGTQLVELVEEEARARNAKLVDLWSDTRFHDAHRLYERMGYQRQPETRDLKDLSHSIEYHYIKSMMI